MATNRLQEQLEMIKRGDHEEIMDYIFYGPLDGDAEVALLKRGNHEEIMEYLSSNYPSEDLQTAVYQRNNAEEIAAMEEWL